MRDLVSPFVPPIAPVTHRQLVPHAIDIRQNGEGLLLIADGEERIADRAVRCFPFTTPDRWISFRDDTDAELGLLPALNGLNARARTALEAHLKARYDIPIIQSLRNIETGKQGGAIWHVHTEEGPASFALRGDQSLSLNAFPEVVFTDAITRKRYKIPDFTKLDRTSQKIARVHLPMGSRHGSRRRGSRGRRG